MKPRGRPKYTEEFWIERGMKCLALREQKKSRKVMAAELGMSIAVVDRCIRAVKQRTEEVKN